MAARILSAANSRIAEGGEMLDHALFPVCLADGPATTVEKFRKNCARSGRPKAYYKDGRRRLAFEGLRSRFTWSRTEGRYGGSGSVGRSGENMTFEGRRQLGGTLLQGTRVVLSRKTP